MNSSHNQQIRIGEITHQWAKAQKIPSHYSERTDSTNLQAKEKAFSEESLREQLILFVTDQQTAGKGRGKNVWLSPDSGAQLLSTWSFMINQPCLPILSPLIGLAVYKAALSTWPFLFWSLKAPNDLLLGTKKTAGILLETVSQGDEHRLLIGLGLNVIQSPSEIITATSIAEELSESTPLLAQDWISFLERMVFEFSIAIQSAYEPLTETAQASILHVLNLNPNITEKIIRVDENANLTTETKTISWLEL